ncbi:MAG: Ni/Fe hydrogenase [Comamonadaceae bacterium CG1_02_60_18]|nr:MAG: Ni/Fe hydrogenase [Comamonadaceae bacterium CG1_02_60_18]PIQ53980.1 MAG: Ni/Fe hydrogenase [Comamonadaceae bacterium CG12_big_fil_rev_8_21_14_0_65_59_15]
MTAPVLVFGWGNLSRGDDALGLMLVAALREQLPPALQTQVECLDDYQLQVEHALDLVGRSQVLFVDTSVSAAPPFEVSVLQAAADDSVSTHSLSPQALMHVYQQLQGTPAPPCTLLAIRGDSFELGEPPSPAALQHLAAALAWVLDALRSKNGFDC